jgi:hypothetical protein
MSGIVGGMGGIAIGLTAATVMSGIVGGMGGIAIGLTAATVMSGIVGGMGGIAIGLTAATVVADATAGLAKANCTDTARARIETLRRTIFVTRDIEKSPFVLNGHISRKD